MEEQIIELLTQIQELCGVGIESLTGGGEEPPAEEPPAEEPPA